MKSAIRTLSTIFFVGICLLVVGGLCAGMGYLMSLSLHYCEESSIQNKPQNKVVGLTTDDFGGIKTPFPSTLAEYRKCYQNPVVWKQKIKSTAQLVDQEDRQEISVVKGFFQMVLEDLVRCRGLKTICCIGDLSKCRKKLIV